MKKCKTLKKQILTNVKQLKTCVVYKCKTIENMCLLLVFFVAFACVFVCYISF